MKQIHLEPLEISTLIDRVVGPEMHCIDVGSHLGSMLGKFKRRAPRGHHIAIEPVPYKAEWLRRRHRDVDVHQVALSDRDDQVDFYLDSRRSGFSGLRGDRDGTPIRVQCRRLDDLVPPDRRIGFLKVDVEGHEAAVFRGAREVLTRDRPLILFECGPNLSRPDSAELFGFLVGEIGYDIFLIHDWLAQRARLTFEQFQLARTFPFEAFNFVAVPRP